MEIPFQLLESHPPDSAIQFRGGAPTHIRDYCETTFLPSYARLAPAHVLQCNLTQIDGSREQEVRGEYWLDEYVFSLAGLVY